MRNKTWFLTLRGLPGGASGKESACKCRRCKRCGFDPWVRKISWRRKWQPTPVFLPGESHGQRSLAGCSPRGCRVWEHTLTWPWRIYRGIHERHTTHHGNNHCEYSVLYMWARHFLLPTFMTYVVGLNYSHLLRRILRCRFGEGHQMVDVTKNRDADSRLSNYSGLPAMPWTSLVVPWLRLAGDRVRSLVRELDPTCWN